MDEAELTELLVQCDGLLSLVVSRENVDTQTKVDIYALLRRLYPVTRPRKS